MSRSLWIVLMAALAFALLMPGMAAGSILIAENGRKPALKVARNGDAEVGWTNAKGARQRMLVPFKGRVLPGGQMQGKNVAKRNSRWALPFKPILRKAPNGFFYALQTWRPRPGKPAELRFSRWKGAPPQLTLSTEFNGVKESLTGGVVFRKKPVFGTSPTTAGLQLKIFLLLDCRVCPPKPSGGWARMVGLQLKSSDGMFSLNVRPTLEGSDYRAQLAGPNRGRHLAPDVKAVATSARPPA